MHLTFAIAQELLVFCWGLLTSKRFISVAYFSKLLCEQNFVLNMVIATSYELTYQRDEHGISRYLQSSAILKRGKGNHDSQAF